MATPVLAARRHRFAAAFIDGLIFLAATFLTGLPFAAGQEGTGQSPLIRIAAPYGEGSGWPIQVAASVVFAAYFWVQHALWGQTPGKRLCHLKVMSGSAGQTPGMRQAGIRALVHPLLTSVPFLGVLLSLVDLLWIFGDRRRRCLHDVIAGTVVIDLRDRERKGSGFLLGVGILVSLFVAFVLVATLLAT
ncbi:RDD family protein [Microbispora sp. NPDC049125]|uniref:RDD family protein n=1 Tax=Microbispora sp. NPDC049125 TaxID=3154929 RepID=UPI0034654F7F